MTTVYIVRHAEAQGNVDEVFQGRTDCEVTENGYRQLDALAEKFKDIDIDVLYASPMKRTLETARAVNKYHNLPIITDDNLIEINLGVLEGVKWDDVPDLYPEEYGLWINDISEFNVKDGESMRNVYDRMKKALTEIVRANAGKRIAVVSHGCAIRNYLCFAKGVPFKEIDSIPWCDNTSIAKIEYNDELVPEIIFFNNTEHLKSSEMKSIHFRQIKEKE